MCGRCTVDNDQDHLTIGYHHVKCTACATLKRSTYRDFRCKADHYRETGNWLSIKAIQAAQKATLDEASSSSSDHEEDIESEQTRAVTGIVV